MEDHHRPLGPSGDLHKPEHGIRLASSDHTPHGEKLLPDRLRELWGPGGERNETDGSRR